MRRLSVVLMIGVLVGGAWLAVPGRSRAGEISISLGVGFTVGGASFQMAYGTGGYLPYYYRLATPLYYPGYDCSTQCYLRGGFYYHAPYCPVVHHHFGRYRYEGPYYGAHYYGPRDWHRGKLSHRHRSGHRHPGYGHGRYHRGESRYLYGSPTRYGAGSRGRAVSHHAEKKQKKGRGRVVQRDRDRRHEDRHSRAPGSARRTRPS